MESWTHMLCGKTTKFPKGTDPNKTNAPCRYCNVALGGWAPA